MTARTQRRTIELRYGDESDVVVTPADEDRFALSVDDAIAACHAHTKEREFRKQHKILFEQLTRWLRDHKDTVERAYLTTRDNGLLFLVVTRSKEMDPNLQDSLTELDVEIANDAYLDLIRLSVLAIPNASESNIESFIC